MLLLLQEVQAGPASALEAVVAADVQLMALRAEEAELNRRLGVTEDANSAGPAENGHIAADVEASEQEAAAAAEAVATSGMVQQLSVRENGSSAPNGHTSGGAAVSHAVPFDVALEAGPMDGNRALLRSFLSPCIDCFACRTVCIRTFVTTNAHSKGCLWLSWLLDQLHLDSWSTAVNICNTDLQGCHKTASPLFTSFHPLP